jgi:hypothetical protein
MQQTPIQKVMAQVSEFHKSECLVPQFCKKRNLAIGQMRWFIKRCKNYMEKKKIQPGFSKIKIFPDSSTHIEDSGVSIKYKEFEVKVTRDFKELALSKVLRTLKTS